MNSNKKAALRQEDAARKELTHQHIPCFALRRAEAAVALSISENTVLHWEQMGLLRSVKIGNCRVYPCCELRAALRRMLRDQHITSPSRRMNHDDDNGHG